MLKIQDSIHIHTNPYFNIKQNKRRNLKREIDSNIIIVGAFNIPFSSIIQTENQYRHIGLNKAKCLISRISKELLQLNTKKIK